MNDYDQWERFLEHYDIDFVTGSKNGITPYVRFGNVEIYFGDDGEFYDYSVGVDNEYLGY